MPNPSGIEIAKLFQYVAADAQEFRHGMHSVSIAIVTAFRQAQLEQWQKQAWRNLPNPFIGRKL